MALAQQVPARDAPAQPRTGTATIAGTIVTADTESPVRRARVMLDRTDGPFDGQTATTDDEGRFAFRQLPAGRFTIDVRKAGFLGASYGASRPMRIGSRVSVGDGARLTGLTIRLARGLAITGTVRDGRGRPVSDVPVTVWRVTYTAFGERSLQRSAADSMTDDRGVYRAWGLPMGEYLVMAKPIIGVPNGPGSGDFQRLTTDEIERALAVPRGVNAGTVPESPKATLGVAGALTANYAPVFHPDAPSPEAATIVSLTTSGDRAGVDITIRLAPTARLSGTVRSSDGRDPNGTTVTLSATGELTDALLIRPQTRRVDADGRFEFQNVVPGHYTVLAKASPPDASPPSSAAQPTPVMWAQTTIDVNGTPLEIPLLLQPAMTAQGRLVFEGTPAPELDVTTLAIRLLPVGGAGYMANGPTAGIAADRTFTLTGVTPGQYRIVELSTARWPGGWMLKSVLANGRDASDGLTIVPGDNVELLLTYTDRPTEITGTLQNATGRPAPEYFIVVFPADQRDWRSARRLVSTRPGTDGHYSIRALPPGEYFLAALTDFQNEDLWAPSFLTEVSTMAIRVTVAEGQVTRQDLRIGR